MDSTQNNAGVFGGNDETIIGEVNGEEITMNDYNQLYQVNEGQYRALQTRGPEVYRVNEYDQEQIGRQTWLEITTQQVMAEAYKDLGIGITDKELAAVMMAPSPNSRVQQVVLSNLFVETGSTQPFNPSLVSDFVNNLDIPVMPGEDLEFGRKRKLYEYLKKFLIEDRQKEKYNSLVEKAFYPSSWMAEMVYEEQGRTINFDYLYFPYAEISATELEITDKDIEGFMMDSPARFETDEYRKVRYLIYDIVASADDSAAARDEVMTYYDGLQNPPKTDSIFVNQNSNIPFNFGYYTQTEYQNPEINRFFSTDSTSAELDTGDIVGPYFELGSYKLSKLNDKVLIPDSVRVSQIVITFDQVTTQEEFVARYRLADSLFRQIDSFGANFAQVAAIYSNDQTTAPLGGDMGYLKKGELNDVYLDNNIFVKGGRDSVFMGFLDAAQQSVYYIMKITDYPEPTTEAIRLATISKPMFISEETDQYLFSKADRFAYIHNSGEKFMAAFESDTFSTPNTRMLTAERVTPNDFNFGEFRNARSILSTIFNNEEGFVSTVIRRDNKLMVLYIEKAVEEGMMDIEEARLRFEAEVLKEKQGDALIERIGSYSSLPELASVQGKATASAIGLTFNDQSMNGLFEPLVIASAAGLETGQTSKPIRGNDGVYVLAVTNTTSPATTSDLTPYIQEVKLRYRSLMTRSDGTNGKIIDAVVKDANIEDKRLANQL